MVRKIRGGRIDGNNEVYLDEAIDIVRKGEVNE